MRVGVGPGMDQVDGPERGEVREEACVRPAQAPVVLEAPDRDSPPAPSSTGTSTMRGFPRSVTMRGRPRSLRAQLASESCALVTSRVFIILKGFIAPLPPADADLLALLDAHRAYNNGGRSLFDDVIVHPEIADTELPGGQRVWAHWLAIPGLHGGLGGQLNLDGV